MPPVTIRPSQRILSAALSILLLFMAATALRAAPLDQALAAVFTVHSADDADRFLGSAFLWQGGGIAVTNAHVVGDAGEVRLTDSAGQTEVARVIARDAVRDVAVLAVSPGREGLPPGPAPALGMPVFALGAPLGLGFSATGGMVSAVARQVEPSVPLRLVQHDAAVNPGSSGGPLVDAEGRLIGMNSRIADGSRLFVGIAYALSAADLDRIVTGLVNGTLPPFPELGLRLRPVDRQIATALGIAPGGVLIDDVRPGSLSAAAGLAPGDVLLSLDGTRIAIPGDMAFAIDAALPLGRTDVLLHRDGIETELSLGLVPPPAPPPPEDSPERGASYDLASLGLQVDDSGVVAVVAESSPGRFAGLATGDRVLRVNGIETGGAALQDLHLTAPALLLVQRGSGSTLHIYLDPWARTPGLRPVGGANVLDPAVVVF